MSASTVQPFRPYPEPGSDTKGTFRPYHFYSNTIRQGSGFHFGFLVPHVLLPLYLAYRLLKMTGFWTSTLQYFIDSLLVPLLQGFSVGGILITFTMRFVSPTGRTINHKKSENAATPSEEKRQKHSEEALWAFIYLGAATLLWQLYPSADGPGVASLKRIASRISIGIDMGESWRPKHH